MKVLKSLIHKIKYTFSYPYRIEMGWGLSAVRSDKELKAVVEFCRNELKEKEYMELNPDRKRIYEMTVLLYEQGLSNDREVFCKFQKFELAKQTQYNDVEDFINDYVSWYWD